MADWSLLRSALGRVDESVRYTWDELDALVGGMPASATRHRAWWSGDRPHVNAWRLAGFTVANLKPGREVTFVRVRRDGVQIAGTEPSPLSTRTITESATRVRASNAPVVATSSPTLRLVACVKEKLSVPAAARDLYISPLFRKERAYAERSGLPWFILSAEHGLVAPDEWLAPYERYLPDTPTAFRRAWGMWVVERLALLAGPLRNQPTKEAPHATETAEGLESVRAEREWASPRGDWFATSCERLLAVLGRKAHFRDVRRMPLD